MKITFIVKGCLRHNLRLCTSLCHRATTASTNLFICIYYKTFLLQSDWETLLHLEILSYILMVAKCRGERIFLEISKGMEKYRIFHFITCCDHREPSHNLVYQFSSKLYNTLHLISNFIIIKLWFFFYYNLRRKIYTLSLNEFIWNFSHI